MVKIRLRRTGAKKKPSYRIVVADSRAPRNGKVIEQLGFYDPMRNPAVVKIDADAVNGWVSKGAQLTDSVRRLMKIAVNAG